MLNHAVSLLMDIVNGFCYVRKSELKTRTVNTQSGKREPVPTI